MPSSPSHPSTPSPSGKLLTRQWLDPYPDTRGNPNGLETIQSYKESAKNTKGKLDELWERLDRHGDKIEGGRILDPLETLHWLRQKVGMWYILRQLPDQWIVRDELLPNDHPKSSWHQSYWDDLAWGWEEEQYTALLRIMLSSTAITWLNELNKWCDEVELTNERKMI